MTVRGRLRALAATLGGSGGSNSAAPANAAIWERIEAMDFGIHEQLDEMRATARRELAELRRENVILYRRVLELEASANRSMDAVISDS